MKLETIAQRANVRTVRHHERQALLPSARQASDHRRYVVSDIAPLRFGRRPKPAGRLQAVTSGKIAGVEATLARPTRILDHLRVESHTWRSAIEQRQIHNAIDEDRA